MEIFKLFGSIFVDTDKANESISKTEKKTDGLGKKFVSGAKTVGKWGAVVGGAAMAGGAAIFAMGVKVGNTADRLLDLNSITGMSTDEIQKWQQVATVAGVNAEAMTNASQKLTKQLSLMDTEGNRSRQALEGLGLSIDDINNMNADERMNTITEALMGVEDQTLRAQYGTDLLGGTFQEIAPILDVGKEKLQDIKDNAKIVSNDDLNAANNFRIQVDQLKEKFGLFFMELSIKVLPILTTFFDWIMQYMPQIQAFVELAFMKISEYIGMGIQWIGKLIGWLKDWYNNNQETVDAIKDGFILFFDTVKELIQSFIDLAVRFWKEYGDEILSFIEDTWEIIKSVFQGAFDLIIDIFNVFSALFKGDWEGLWESVKTLASNLWDNIKDIIGDAIDTVVGVFEDINLYSIGKNIIQGLINGISNMIGAVKRKAQEVASAIGDKVKGFFGINSPSRLMMEYGGHIGEGLAVGVEDSKKKVERATESMASASTATFEQMKPLDVTNTTTNGINFNRGAFEGAIITDDYGVDRLMERIVERLQNKTGLMA